MLPTLSSVPDNCISHVLMPQAHHTGGIRQVSFQRKFRQVTQLRG